MHINVYGDTYEWNKFHGATDVNDRFKRWSLYMRHDTLHNTRVCINYTWLYNSIVHSGEHFPNMELMTHGAAATHCVLVTAWTHDRQGRMKRGLMRHWCSPQHSSNTARWWGVNHSITGSQWQVWCTSHDIVWNLDTLFKIFRLFGILLHICEFPGSLRSNKWKKILAST